MVEVCTVFLLLPLMAGCLETIGVYMAHVCFYVRCSDCAGVCVCEVRVFHHVYGACLCFVCTQPLVVVYPHLHACLEVPFHTLK